MDNYLKLLVFLFLFHNATSSALISVDFGSQFIKTGIIQHGRSPTVVLNSESKRKTPTAYFHQGNERLFGEAALAKMVKNRKNTFLFIRDLLGKTLQDPAVEIYQRRFPYYNLTADEEGNLFFAGTNPLYVEEIAALVLRNALSLAYEFAETSALDVTISVPASFNTPERAAMLRVGKIAGLKSFQLVSDTACALSEYAINHRKEKSTMSKDLALLDVGASKTTLTIFAYQPKNGTDNPKAVLKSIKSEMGFGGVDMVICLRDYIIDLFMEGNEQIEKSPLEKDDKLMSKLFIQAEKSLSILSSNKETTIFFENVFNGLNLDVKIDRAKFEDRLLSFSNLTSVLTKLFLEQEEYLNNVSQVIFFGAATRIPLIQKIIENSQFEILFTLNTDEAIATGGAYRGASMSTMFRIVPFSVEDVWIHPINITLSGTQRVLMTGNQTLPVKIILRLTNESLHSPFSLGIFCDGEPLFNAIVSYAVPENETYDVIKVHFLLNQSGILEITKAELQVKQVIEETDNKDNNDTVDSLNISTTAIPKNESVLLPLTFSCEPLYFTGPSPKLLNFIIDRIDSYSKEDQIKKDKYQLQNDIESACLSAKNNIEDKKYSPFVTEADKESILFVVHIAFDWLDMVSIDDPIEEYQKMWAEVTNASKSWNFRYAEYLGRPKCRASFTKLIQDCRELSKTLKEVAQRIESGSLEFDKEFLTDREMDTFYNQTTDFHNWFTNNELLQNETSLSDTPVWIVKDFEKMSKSMKRKLDSIKWKFTSFVSTAKKKSVDLAKNGTELNKTVPEKNGTELNEGIQVENVKEVNKTVGDETSFKDGEFSELNNEL